MKYELLLKAIYEHTERGGLKDELPNLNVAIEVMRVSIYYYIDVLLMKMKSNAGFIKIKIK